MGALKDLVRPPFANYDVVVYFGAGLFAIPFLIRYVGIPLGVPRPEFLIAESDQVVLEIVRVLTIITFVYVLGHLIAYFSSQMVEKALDRFLGKVSTAILVSSSSSHQKRNERIRKHFRTRTSSIKHDNALTSSVVRGLFHLPNFPLYLIVYGVGVFGYFDTRMTQESLRRAELVYKRHVHGGDFSTDTKWFKPLEYFVINRIPSAVPRMYNYMVIAGLFRSLSFIFLISAWWTLIYCLAYLVFGTWPLGLDGMGMGFGVGIIEYSMLSAASVFCIMAYIKFQRRYAEEAILALAYWCEND